MSLSSGGDMLTNELTVDPADSIDFNKRLLLEAEFCLILRIRISSPSSSFDHRKIVTQPDWQIIYS